MSPTATYATPAHTARNSPYHLDPAVGEPRNFQDTLERFTDRFLEQAEQELGEFIDARLALGAAGGLDPERSRGEYAVELLTFGILREEYAVWAGQTPPSIRRQMKDLWDLRSNDPEAKHEADARRAQLFWNLLHGPHLEFLQPCEDPILIDWLESTGEFVQESIRMRLWLEGIGVFWSPEEFFQATRDLARWFEESAKQELAEWTRGVDAYRARALAETTPREDLLLITRRERLYHLNMVGAEAMNRGFRPGFTKRPKKVVLVPGCMRSRDDRACMALRRGTDISCAHCDRSCNVSRLTELGEQNDFKVYVVPHASTFTAWLKRWQEDGQTALVAAACPLHLVPGGYEMRALGLQAQCVFLRYSGCKRHWDPTGTPTEIDADRLLDLLSQT
ncbi:MAG: DUF116 domain-containing protein [Fibrobacteres bacterium]|nr:DUF116 domain-containing protein [Fibrobacterota bacterium]